MSAEHTPGPWKSEPVAYPAGKDISFEILDANRRVVAQTIMREIGKGWRNEIIATDEANARLMAAAPELLEALIMALPYVESCEDDPAYKPMAVKLRVKMMRAAIAKAEGQSTRRDGPVLREGVAS